LAGILASIRHNLTHVADFSGRDPPGRFWPYAIFLFLLSMVVGMLLWVPVMADMFVRLQRYLVEHPEGLPIDTGVYPARMPPELVPDLSAMTIPLAILNLLFVLLLAAALVRRLHDRDKSGWWALMPVPFMIFGQVQGREATTMMMGAIPADPALILPMALNSLFYWIAVIALVIMLIQQGTHGPNRYGPGFDPV
jgi:uncharacterized membrane protein YhaH (DUF805 family)